MKYVFFPLLLAFLTACDFSLQSLEESFAKVKIGQTTKQVLKVMGKPHSKEEATVLGISNQTFYWQDLEQKYQVKFIKGLVYDKSSAPR